jgi:hypothetical protein
VKLPALKLFVIGLILASTVGAQTQTATIVGTVSDSSGAVIAGAGVRVANADSGVVAWSGTSGSAGEYAAPLLPAGNYNIIAEHPGFKKVAIDRLILTLGQRAEVNLVMTPGEVVESITISGGDVATALLDTATSWVGTLITPSEMRDLPLNGNDATQLMTLVPGVSTGGTSGGITSYQMSINGGKTLSTEVTLDGTSVIENATGQISALPPPDALQEFRAMTSAYSAENGRSGGGTVAVAVKSGTNGLHGGLYELMKNEDLDANNFFNNLKGVHRPMDRYNQFGGTVSGPVFIPRLYNGKNKTFFLYNFNDTLTRSPTVITETVPSAAFKSGDFSSATIKIYDPASGAYGLRTPFPNNVIPVTRLDPTAAKYMALLPLPNALGSLDPQNSRSINNWVKPEIVVSTGPRHTGKLDEALGDKIRLFGSIFQWASNGPVAATLPGPLNSSASGWHNGWDGAFGLTHIITPTLFLDVRFGFYRWIEMSQPDSTGTNVAQALGIASTPVADVPPYIAITNWQAMGPPTVSVKNNYSNTFQTGASLVKVFSAHNLKTGFTVRKIQFNSFYPNSYYNGEYSFGGTITNQGGVGGNAVDTLADFLLGKVTSATYEIPQPLTGRRHGNVSAYVQDDWKVNSRLTINAGLRWEYESPTTVVNNLFSIIDLNTGGMLVAGVNASPSLNLNASKRNFDPRLGFAYSLTPKTVIRAAAGMFYAGIPLGGNYSYPGFDVVQNFPQPGAGLAQSFSLSQGMPLTAVQNLKNPFAALQNATIANPFSASQYFYQYQPLPTIYQWNFGVQRDLGFRTVLEVNYIGNHGAHLPMAISLNTPAFAAGQQLAIESNTVDTQEARPFPTMSTFAGTFNAGSSHYEALQVTARRQFSEKIAFQVAYTWARALDDGDGNGFSQPQSGASLDQFPNLFRNIELGPTNFDIPQRLVTAVQYRTTGNRWVRNFQISPIFVAQNGLPITISQTSEYSGVTLQRPMVSGASNIKLANWTSYGQAIQYLMPVTSPNFPLTPSGPIVIGASNNRVVLVPAEIGSLGRNTIRGPDSVNLNLSVARRFALREHLSLQLRLDAFNALNRVNLALPATSLTVATSGNQAIFNGSTFGLITSANSARFVQAVARIDF